MMQQLFLVFILSAFLVKDDSHLIEWSASRKLSWSDFKAAPDPSSSNAALTNSSIFLDLGYNDTKLTYSIRCRFNPLRSWGRIKDDYILNHEQRHFDISEIHARMLHKGLKHYVFRSKTVNEDTQKIYQGEMQRHVEMQQQYDRETNHSLNSDKQKEWNNRIDSLLIVYQPYADYRK